jgi:hypothetical protein
LIRGAQPKRGGDKGVISRGVILKITALFAGNRKSLGLSRRSLKALGIFLRGGGNFGDGGSNLGENGFGLPGGFVIAAARQSQEYGKVE